MPEPVPRLGCIFADEIMRRVAIVAGCDRLVARLQPAAVLVFHDVAIRTGERIVAHVRIALAVPERVHAHADRETEPNAENDKF